MTTQTEERTARLEARIAPSQKAMFQRAADIQGQTLTDFIVSSAYQEAVRTISTHDVMELSARDQAVFVNALLTPPEPGNRLRQAAERYHDHTPS